jgi:hypothetical protein
MSDFSERQNQVQRSLLTFTQWRETTTPLDVSYGLIFRSMYRLGNHYIFEPETARLSIYYYTSHSLPDTQECKLLLEPFGATLEQIYDPEGYATPFFTTLEDAFNFCNYFSEHESLFGAPAPLPEEEHCDFEKKLQQQNAEK